ncbi:hypothetical protein [Agromyces sp. SYSU T00266]|uniref:hypothetical protein n=1 Tax=Agromyces zhanjiangensis TaxID=3158562 RepID=UPI0033951F61
MALRLVVTVRLFVGVGAPAAVRAGPLGPPSTPERCERLLDAVDRIAVTGAAVLLAHPSRLHVS